MRTFDSFYLILFLIFYFFISFLFFFSLKQVLKLSKSLTISIIIFQFLLLAAFIIFFIYPFSPIETKSYKIYFILNTVILIDVLSKLPVSVLFLLSKIFFLKKVRQLLLTVGFICSVVFTFILLYGVFTGSNQLETKQIEIDFKERLPSEFNNYKIVQLSDIHLGSFNAKNKLLEKALIQINRLKPDLILFTGDLVNNFSEEVTDYRISLFQKYLTGKKCYSILGNHDYGNYSIWNSAEEKQRNFDNIVYAHKKLGFRLLRNENVVLKNGNDSIYLIGVENWGHPPFPQYAKLEKAMNGITEGSFEILMTHDPAHWKTKVVNKTKIELSLSGHTHGLQWGVKLAGIPFSLSYKIRENWGGLYQTNNQYLYVNTGLGMVGIPWRIDLPAEITLITLKRGKIN